MAYFTVEQQLKLVFCILFLIVTLGIMISGIGCIIYSFQGWREYYLVQYDQVLQQWKQTEYYQFQNLTMNIVKEEDGSLSEAFQTSAIKEETQAVRTKDFYNYKGDYDALFYQLKSQEGTKIGIEEFHRYPEDHDHSLTLRIKELSGMISDIEIANLTIFETRTLTVRSQFLCTQNYGWYDNIMQQCHTYYRITKVCVKISKNETSQKWELNDEMGTYGCLGPNKTVAEFELIKVLNNDEINDYFPMNVTITIKVRNAKDPFLVASILTGNTFNFGISSKDMLVLGIAFAIIGFFTSIQPAVFIWKMNQESKRGLHLSQDNKQIKKEIYESQFDEQDSVLDAENINEPNQNDDMPRKKKRNKQKRDSSLVEQNEIKLYTQDD